MAKPPKGECIHRNAGAVLELMTGGVGHQHVKPSSHGTCVPCGVLIVGSKGALKFKSLLQRVKPFRKQTMGLSGVAAGGLPVGYRARSGSYFTLGWSKALWSVSCVRNLCFWLQLAFFSQAAFWLCVHTILWQPELPKPSLRGGSEKTQTGPLS
ncbi:hypothetical protein mRhiFer1_009986 [Rhinolophus ferrumequinum]|uniref:Uncharacterized protein n=1 Tax=Rhinolophus ferrumequinum TaxID=59479 RepID=A0A7J7Y4Z5_RHIFE|nr:hypothetical protein mRhiFer1_009986 [Rhinolophus ferrumequinum]